MDAAIAEGEGELGMIPPQAADEIRKKANGNYVKVSRVAELAREKGLDIAAELSALAEVCEKGTGECIRLGSSGIDNYETAWGLLIKDALTVTLRDLDRLIGILADLEIYEHTLLKNALRIEDGLAYVPAGSGLGVEISPEALAKYRIKLH